MMPPAPDNPTQNDPALPVELLESIFDEVTVTSDLSSPALASHALRDIANKRRFRSLVLNKGTGHDVKFTSKKIEALADLIKDAHHFSTMRGIIEFTTSLSLTMIGYYDEVTPAMNSGSLAYIFQHIFRSIPSECSLSLDIYRWARTDDEYFDDSPEYPKYNGLSWRTIKFDLRDSLRGLIQTSKLTRLTLASMNHVPIDLLQGTNIKHLHLFSAKLDSRRPTCISNPVLLESLDMEPILSVEELGSLIHPYSYAAEGPTFYVHPRLVNLTIAITYRSALDSLNRLLQYTPALQALNVDLRMTSRHMRQVTDDKWTIMCSNLAHLQSISLQTLDKNKFEDVARILPMCGIPSNLGTISFTVIHQPYSSTNAAAIIQYLEYSRINGLDGYLTQSAFNTVTSIHIVVKVQFEQYDYDQYKHSKHDIATLERYVRGQIPLLLKQKPASKVCVVYMRRP